MQPSRVFTLVAAAFVAGFLTARWWVAQPPNQPGTKYPASDDNVALEQYESFVTYLQDTKQTNILQRFNELENSSLTLQHYADLGVTLSILQWLRDGRTNEAYAVLESKLGSHIIGYAACYRELPASLRGQENLKILARARDYHAKYPSQHPSPIIDEGVANAFKILDENTAK